MATTASITLASDLMTDSISVSSSTTCTKAGTTADNLDGIEMGYLDVATGDQYDILDATALGLNKANKVYLCNESTDETHYVIVEVKAEVLGRLYGGDWMFIPWGAESADSDIEITAITGTNKIGYALFHEGKTLTAS